MDAGCSHGPGPWGPAVPLRPSPVTVHPAVCGKHCPALHSQETPSFTTQAAARPELGPSSSECGEPRPLGRRAPGTSLALAQARVLRDGGLEGVPQCLGRRRGPCRQGSKRQRLSRQSVKSIKSPSLLGGAQPRPWQERGQGSGGKLKSKTTPAVKKPLSARESKTYGKQAPSRAWQPAASAPMDQHRERRSPRIHLQNRAHELKKSQSMEWRVGHIPFRQ